MTQGPLDVPPSFGSNSFSACERLAPCDESRAHAKKAMSADLGAQLFRTRLQCDAAGRLVSNVTPEMAREGLERSPEFKSLDPENQARAGAAVTSTPFGIIAGHRASTLREIIGTVGFRALSPSDQGKVIELYPDLRPFPASQLVNMSRSGQLYALGDGDKGRPLDQLHLLATKPLAPGQDRELMMDSGVRGLLKARLAMVVSNSE